MRCTVQYYLRLIEHYQSPAWRRRSRDGLSWGVIVEYMDRAQGHTQDFLPQTLRLTIHTTAKLSYLGYFFMADVAVRSHKQTTKRPNCGLSWRWQLSHDTSQSTPSKNCNAKGITACKHCCRRSSRLSYAATAADQQSSHHEDLHDCSTSVQGSQTIEWNVPRARASAAS